MNEKEVRKCILCEEPTYDISDLLTDKTAIPHGNDYCKECLGKYSKVCTCNKKFITEEPVILVFSPPPKEGTDLINYYVNIPKDIPEFLLTEIQGGEKGTGTIGGVWHIFGCRGCTLDKQTVETDFDAAVHASIVSCVYHYDKDSDLGIKVFKYLSDSLDPHFEKYLEEQGITLGEPQTVKYN
jgi:hypothetical protein